MEQKTTEQKIEVKDNSLNKPSIARRFLSGTIDFLFSGIVFFGLFLLTYYFVFPSLGYFAKFNEINTIYRDSNLYIENHGQFYQIGDKVAEGENLDTAYGDRIVHFYTFDERAVSENKIETYTNAQIASDLFVKSGDKYISKSDADAKQIKNFYEKQYDSALDFLLENPRLVKLSNDTYVIMMVSMAILIVFVTFIFYCLIPMLTKNNSTLAQLIFKIGLANKNTNDKVKWYKVLLRYGVLLVVSFVAPFLVYLKWNYVAVFIIAIDLLLMCVTKERIGFHDAVSNTYLVDLRKDYIIQREKGVKFTDENDRVSKLLGK